MVFGMRLRVTRRGVYTDRNENSPDGADSLCGEIHRTSCFCLAKANRHLALSEAICCIAGSKGRLLIATTGRSSFFAFDFASVESELIKSSRHSAEQFSPRATWTEARSDSDEAVSTSLLPRSKIASETCSRN